MSKSENTCNALLCEELRKLGTEAFFEEHYLTEFGRNKPDIHITHEGANYLIEGKQRPRKLVDAVSKAYTYRERLRSYISPKAVFAVLYPPDCFGSCDTAVLLDVSPFYIAHTASSLSGLAEWIHSIMTTPPVEVELNTSDAIRLLQQAVIGLAETFSELQPQDMEDIFGGKVFFETVLGIEEEKEIPIQHLRDGASYLLINQILFYQILAKKKKGIIRYKEINSEKLDNPSRLQADYFARVLLEDYRPIFGFDVASKVTGPKSLEAIKVAIDAVNALAPGNLDHDILGKIFHNLIPLDLRKVVAAFYTNIQAGEILASLAIDNPSMTVIDPACGSGTLLVSSYQRKRSLLKSSGRKFSYKDHEQFIEKDITGIDIMPFAAHLAAVHLSLQDPCYTTDFVRVAIQDSTKLKPGTVISPAQEVLKEAFKQQKLTEVYPRPQRKAKETVTTGPVELSDRSKSRGMELSKTDIVIMNPPFTRFQRIPPSYKTKLKQRFNEPRFRKCVHGQLGLHGYFLLLADRFLEKDGKIAAVLPLTTLSAKGFYDIQDLWLNNYALEHLVVCEGRSAFSENVAVREILLVARKGKVRNNQVAISVLKVPPDKISIAEARSLAQTLKELREKGECNRIIDSQKFLFKLLPQKELANNKRALFRAISTYRKGIAEISEEIGRIFDKSKRCITFGEYMKSAKGSIHESPRGIERFGYYGLSIVREEKRALKKHDFWFVKETTKKAITVENRFSHLIFEVPTSCVFENIRRYVGLLRFDISHETDYVVTKVFNELENFINASTIDSYLKKEALKVVRNGEWKDFVEKHSSKIALIYRARITGKNTHNLAFYSKDKMFFGGSFWMVDIPDDIQSKLLTLWFNSTLNLFQFLVERKETEGAWIWIDDYVLREFMMLDLLSLSHDETNLLLETFEKLGREPMPSLFEQIQNKNDTRVEIDKTFLRLLKMPEEAIDSFLSRLYAILTDEFDLLSSVASD